MKCKVYWADILIGILYFNKDKGYKYLPNLANIEEASKDGLLPTLVNTPQPEWGEIPQYLAKRIEADPELKNEGRYVTDKIRIVKDEKS